MKNYLYGLIGLCFSLLVGCQTLSQGNFLGMRYSDESISAAVNSRFASHPDLATAPIQVQTQKGVVLLNGYVKTIRQTDTAQALAEQTPGVKSVRNGLIVRK